MRSETLLRAFRKSVDGYHVSRLYIGGFGIAKRNGTFRVKRPSDYSRQVDKFQSRLLERLNARCESCAFCSWDSGYRAGWKCGNKNASMLWVEADDHCVKWRKRR